MALVGLGGEGDVRDGVGVGGGADIGGPRLLDSLCFPLYKLLISHLRIHGLIINGNSMTCFLGFAFWYHAYRPFNASA